MSQDNFAYGDGLDTGSKATTSKSKPRSPVSRNPGLNQAQNGENAKSLGNKRSKHVSIEVNAPSNRRHVEELWQDPQSQTREETTGSTTPFHSVERDRKKEERIHNKYEKHWKMCKSKKNMYNYAAGFYNSANLIIFQLPLFALAAANTILPTILGEQEKSTISLATTCIGAATTLLVSVQATLQWGKRSERYNSIATVFEILAGQTHYLMADVQFSKKMTKEKTEELLNYLRESEKTAKNALNGAQLLPFFITLHFRKTNEKETAEEARTEFQTTRPDEPDQEDGGARKRTGTDIYNAVKRYFHEWQKKSINESTTVNVTDETAF